MNPNQEFSEYIRNKYWSEFDLSMPSWFTRCNFAGIVRHNTDRTLKRKETIENEDVCVACRGKGHSWKCKVWNGRPYIIKEYKNGLADTSKIDWENPDWCKDCKGSGIKCL